MARETRGPTIPSFLKGCGHRWVIPRPQEALLGIPSRQGGLPNKARIFPQPPACGLRLSRGNKEGFREILCSSFRVSQSFTIISRSKPTALRGRNQGAEQGWGHALLPLP